MCLSYYLVHTKLHAKEDDIAMYKGKREKLGISKEQEFLAKQPWMETATGNS